MIKYEYKISKKVQQRIYSFYSNVAKKYCNTYDINCLLRNIESAYNGIYGIENGLLRRNPTISRWNGKGYMANTKTWYYLYKIDGNTIYVIDACHSQNMRESHVNNGALFLLQEGNLFAHSRLNEIIKESIKRVLNL